MFIDKPYPRRLSILKSAYHAMQRKVRTQNGKIENRPTGLWFKYHYQVYLFLRFQLQHEGKALKVPDLFTGVVGSLVSREGLGPKVVLDGGRWGQRTRRRIMRHEVSWVKKCLIPEPNEGRERKVVTLLEDPETILTVRQHILHMGESKFIS